MLTKHAKDVGADAVLSVTGYYNKPSQEGIYHHFATIAEEVDIPIILYNIPGRAIVDISVETMARLSKIANIIGVKDATANLVRPSREHRPAALQWWDRICVNHKYECSHGGRYRPTHAVVSYVFKGFCRPSPRTSASSVSTPSARCGRSACRRRSAPTTGWSRAPP